MKTLALTARSQVNSLVIGASEDIHHYVLEADTAKAVNIPEEAHYAVFSADVDFYCLFGDNPNDLAVSIPTSDVTDGSGANYNPAVIELGDHTTLGLIAAEAGVVTIAFYQ